ncbi:hypothetical protein EMIHUDRAFT_98774, partial [Emiliania huxleyi CCMP1516]|uniref:PWWP domain-containing protein n=2 Tax=Emiliania huxleyi TaxID=2903 RepID=A0A0D3KF66_EMIH1
MAHRIGSRLSGLSPEQLVAFIDEQAPLWSAAAMRVAEEHAARVEQPEWILSKVLLSPDLAPHILAQLPTKEHAVKGTCRPWRRGWKETLKKRERPRLLAVGGQDVKQKAPVLQQWIKETMVGTWQSGEATVTFGVELFSWTTAREVPGVGFVTLKLRTSSITSAIFDKKSNVLKIRGMVEVPMDALNHWYDSFSKPGSPKGYLCLKFQNWWEFSEVIKAVPRLKARAHSGGSVRINLSELTPAVPEAAGHSPVESDWLSDGPRVGARVLRRLKGHGHVHAVVQLYLPAGADDEPALWRIRHADGDEEDLVRTPSLIAVSTASSLHRPSGPLCLTLPSPPLAQEEYELLEALQRFATSRAGRARAAAEAAGGHARVAGQAETSSSGGPVRAAAAAGVADDAEGETAEEAEAEAGSAGFTASPPPPPPPPHREAAPAAPLVTEAEGLRLHLSSSSSTGYKGVRADRSRFKAQRRVGGRLLSIGTFNTAVEAAVAWARAVGEYQPPTVATEADGLRLHLSSSSNAGYRCVFQHASGRRSRFQAQHKVNGRKVSLGYFDTAVEAAVAYARAVGQTEAAGAAEEGDEVGGEEEGGEEGGWSGGGEEESHFQVGGRVAVQYSDGALYPGEVVGFDGASSLYSVRCDDGELLEDVSLHEMLREVGEGEWEEQERASGEGMEVEEAEAAAGSAGPPPHREAAPAAPLVTEAEGLQLHLSSSTSTGYSGVRADRSRFKAQRRVGGRMVYLGSFATAVEAAVAYARAGGEYQPPAPPTVATEAEGLRLHLSSSSSTGYKNVGKLPSGRYQVQHKVGGRQVYLGSFATAVEAAVAYARAKAGKARGPERAAEEAGSAEGAEAEGMEVEQAEEAEAEGSAGGEKGETAEEAEAGSAGFTASPPPPPPPPHREAAPAAPLVTEAEGLQLHLSSSTSTGYSGVRADRSRFKAQRRVGGRMVYLGSFATAVEAAVAYARAVGQAEAAGAAAVPAEEGDEVGGEEEGGEEEEEAVEAREMEAMEAEEAEEAAAAAAEEEEGAEGAPEEEEAAEAAGTAAVSAAAPLVTEAEGLRLHLSSSNATGYKGVYEHSGRFKAQRRVGGRLGSIGKFDTAVEAAVAYARAVGEYQPPAPPTVATEAEGLRLHLSSSGGTGYKGVARRPSGRFSAQHWVDGRLVGLGYFDTAVEAAVAYARAVGQAEAAGAGGPARAAAAAGEAEAGETEEEEAVEAREMEAMEAEEAEEAAAAAEEEDVPPQAEGLRLHLSGCTGSAGLAAGSPCWAKLRGSPWWPALISAEEGESVRVRFCGTGNVATLERASCIKSLREDERLFDATRWGKDFGRPKWKHLRAPFASAVAQALEVEAALPHAPPGALSRGPAGSSADNARRCDERPPKRRRTSAAQEAVQMVADLETADAELDAPPVRRCAVTLDRCLPSSANRGAAPPRLGIGDGLCRLLLASHKRLYQDAPRADVGARTTVQLVNSHNGRQLSAGADSVNNTIRVNATRAARARLRACADNVSLLFYSDEWVKGGPVPDNDARLVALLNQMNNSKCVVPPPFGKLKAFKLSESLAKRHRSGAIVDVFRIAMEDHSARAVTTSNVHHTDSLVDKPAPKERSKAFKLPSAGFYAVHAALLLCSSVSLFGFQDSPQKTFHYWGNQSALDASGSRRFHNFEAEHEYYQRRLKDSAR